MVAPGGGQRVAAGGADAQQADPVGVDLAESGQVGDGGREVLHPLGGGLQSARQTAGLALVAAHMRGQVGAAERARTANKHATSEKITKAATTVIKAFNQLDIAPMWGDGKTVADPHDMSRPRNRLVSQAAL
ncbi:hypothetical protein GCM10022419_129480 [Nonomuraea rosea]|uniref:Tn3 transposase DDE domain-containing protein n=1 Tax=Nonomuraea rosea TaxID=638574 RepID=A0ABP6ZYE7_9ACTN